MPNTRWISKTPRAATVAGWLCLLTSALAVRGELVIANKGKTDCPIVTQAGATDAEKWAARELADTLQKITAADFRISTNGVKKSAPAIIVGQGPQAAELFPEVDFSKLASEECIMRLKGNKLLLAGGRPRGTIYAVSRFLQEQGGVRWWTPWATNVPKRATFRLAELNRTEKPAFEYRSPYWFSAFDPQWKALNCVNSEHGGLPAELGGSIRYKGFAHTFHRLVPPEKHFAEHPEWFSLVKGERSTNRTQLCLTNPDLRDFVVRRVRQWLREDPDAQIVSVTQNDWNGWCECENCKALDDAEGSHSGTMLAFVNYIAEKIEPDFPDVAIDTFAYTYTRKPPMTLHARTNVIVRLCSIECNFREPLTDPSNAAFADDIRKWSKICSHLYVWDYTTDFRNYVHPHPNWFTLGPNVRFFQEHGVKGVFEQGAYQGHGAEMGEMRAWVLAQLLWNPQQDDRALIREFLEGYYGREAAQPIGEYFQLMYNASRGVTLGCFLNRDQLPHLSIATLSAAERLWQQAEKAAVLDPVQLARVREAHLPVRYAFLRSWNRLRRASWEQNATWPLPEPRQVVIDEFRKVCQGVPDKEWTQVTLLNERGLTVSDFLKNLPPERFDGSRPPPPARLSVPVAPPDVAGFDPKSCVDLQDDQASLSGLGKLADIFPDPNASDLRAVWLAGDHKEWAFRIPGVNLPDRAQSGKWNVYAVVRIKPTSKGCPPGTPIFTAGVYDNQTKKTVMELKAVAGDTVQRYHSYLIGTVDINSRRDIWVAPADNPAVRAVWVDRVFLAPAS